MISDPRLPDLFARASDLEGEARAAWLAELRREEPALVEEIEELLAASSDGEWRFRKPAWASLPPDEAEGASGPERVGPFRVLREIGRGGMGRVFLAAQEIEGFERRVALKILAADLGAEGERRFRAERRILASLEHPGIARFLEGGRSAEGIFYLALEYVEGQDLLAHARARDVAIDERVRLFLSVLEAVQFAHSRLVVHRDLKPANILVGADGRPRLLDFGISKLLDPEGTGDAAATRTALRAWTPAYASPEQIRGEAVTVASDVYSLGVVLYELLAGERPYRTASGSPHELERAVLEQEPEAPSTAARRASEGTSGATAAPTSPGRRRAHALGGDLDAIVLKALRKEPVARYLSVEAFAEDLRRYLDRRPVMARRGGRRYRLQKLARRNRVPLAAAALAFLGLTGGLAAALWQRSAALAKGELAQRRFDDVQDLARSLLFEVHDAVRQLPGSLPVQERIIERALLYLEKLEKEAGDDPALLATLASGYERIGIITAGAAGFGLPLVARPERGESAYGRAIALRRRLVELGTGSRQSRRALAQVLTDYGEVHRSRRRLGEMRRVLAEAIAIQQRLAAEDPADADLRYELAAQLLFRAHGERTLAAESAEHLAAEQEAISAWSPLLRSPPAAKDDPRFARRLAILAQTLLHARRIEDAELATRLGLQSVESMPAAGPDRLRDTTISQLLGARRDALVELGRFGEALAAVERSASIRRAWLEEPESRLTNAINLFGVLQQGAALAVRAGEPARAHRFIEEAEGLVAAQGWSGSHAFSAAGFLARLRGDAHSAQAQRALTSAERGRHREAARTAYRRALRVMEELGPTHHGDLGDMLADLRAKLRTLDAKSGRLTR